MDKAVGRIQEAIENGELIHIWRSMMLDGNLQQQSLRKMLEMLGAQVSYYLPNLALQMAMALIFQHSTLK